MGITHDWIAHPLASIIVPTSTRERLPNCLSLFDRQDYPNKELIILLRGGPAASEIVPYINARKDIRALHLPRDEDTGAGMRAGISAAHGEYWFKMDIDDRYGDRYVSDMVLHLSACDADVVGKPPRYYTFSGEPLIYDGAPLNTSELCVLPPEELTRGKAWLGAIPSPGKKRSDPMRAFQMRCMRRRIRHSPYN